MSHWTDAEFEHVGTVAPVASADRIAQWKADPAMMVRELFRAEPDEWQLEALEAFADPSKQRIAMQACAGPGKSTVLAWCGWNFLICYSDGEHHPNGACTSMTGDNLKAGLWKELSLWYERAPELRTTFEVTGTRIFHKNHPLTYFIDARTFAKSADTEAQGRTLSGLHAKAILYLCDESGSTPPPVGRTAEQGLGDAYGEFAKILQAGNPVSHESMLYESVTAQSHLWHVIRITSDPDNPKRTPRKSIEWAREQIALHGRDNPWVMAYILGVFPPSSINALLGPDDIRAAMERVLRPDQFSFAQKRIGVDVARQGDDSTVLFPRQGLQAFTPVEMRTRESNPIAARIVAAKHKWNSELELIDSTGGWAGGVVDFARLAGVHLYEVQFGGKADDRRYANKRSEMHFRAAEWVKNGGALPRLDGLVREAAAPTYTFNKSGQFLIEEKDQIKARIGKSPDFWDAFCCTFALAEMPSGAMQMVGNADGSHTNQLPHEWDPFQ